VHDLGSEALHLKSLITGLKPDLLCFADTEAGREIAARMADAVGQRAYKGFAVPDAVVGKCSHQTRALLSILRTTVSKAMQRC
jgi:hypothetical protein